LLGKAKVMSYGDIEEAKASRAAKGKLTGSKDSVFVSSRDLS
jgi:hypothetical protein